MGERFGFLCTAEQAVKMERVVVCADGRIIERWPTLEGVRMVVEKT
ncbi:MAG: hypothetical protein ACOY4H_11850 [Thermodesulfobacteriota bacterium]